MNLQTFLCKVFQTYKYVPSAYIPTYILLEEASDSDFGNIISGDFQSQSTSGVVSCDLL